MRRIDALSIAGLLAVIAWNAMAPRPAPNVEAPAPQVRRPPIVVPPATPALPDGAPPLIAPPAFPQAGSPLLPAGRADPIFDIELPLRVQDASGTAFAAGTAGNWVTARHVVEGCAGVYLRRDGRWIPVQVAWRHPRADLVVLRGPATGAALPAFEGPLYLGQPGFGVGFPHGVPGAVAGALLGRSTMHVEGRFAGSASVTTWAETLRDPPDPEATLGGISGGPLVDASGQLIGVVVAASIRRGRFHATAPELFADAGIRSTPGAQTAGVIDISNYTAAAARMRQKSVLQAGCKAPQA